MPLLKLRTRTKPKQPLTALESRLYESIGVFTRLSVLDFAPIAAGPMEICRDDARRALSALWRRGLLTRVGWGDTAVYRRRP